MKKFSPKHFEPKSLKIGLDDPDAEEQVILGKRGQINDQLVELPIEHQVYDMIDAEGSKGLTKTEVCINIYEYLFIVIIFTLIRCLLLYSQDFLSNTFCLPLLL